MEMKVIGSTHPGFIIDMEDAMSMSAHAAGVCYMKSNINDIINEDIEDTKKRAELVLNNGHHSVFEHINYNFVFSNIPKILAMILNNENQYTTSEKSGRYTVTASTKLELDFYDKWIPRFIRYINNQYPNLDSSFVNKLALENVRYYNSVFSPGTTMVYTTNLRQINYILEMMEDFIQDSPRTLFYNRIVLVLIDFIKTMEEFRIPGLSCKNKDRKLSLFNTDKYNHEYFGDVYSTNYLGTFAYMAQAMRHRTLDYNMYINENSERRFYVPSIIPIKDIVEWDDDFKALPANWFPQGTLLDINERGTYENFILKCRERLCCQAQHEMMSRTVSLFNKYIINSAFTSKMNLDHPSITNLTPLKNKSQIPYMKCANKCNGIGGKNALTRLV